MSLLIPFISLSLWAISPLQQKYPYGLLTDDYGILSEADLLVETRGLEITPYDIKNDMLAFRRWQCFETKKVEFVADKAGTFSFRCSVPCGSGHQLMQGTLVVLEK